MVPRDMMKPKQKFFRTGLQIRELLTHRRMILSDRVATGFCPVEAQPECVSLVIIDRVPILARLGVPPGRWTIMVPTPHQVMKTERSHVIDRRLMRPEH